MRAICWNGVNDISTETVDDPSIVNPHDAILKVRLSTTCGSDLHFIDGYIPTMREGDVIGHEFMGEIVEVGPEVQRLKPGDRVVIPSFISCGRCWFCEQHLFSLCDNTNPNPEMQIPALGQPTGGIYGYTHAFGGYAGSHAEYMRLVHADQNCFHVPENVRDEQALFLSDAAPTGFMGADFAEPKGGETVAVWGCGGRRADGPAGRPAHGRRAGDRDRSPAQPAGDGLGAPRRGDDRLHAGGVGGRDPQGDDRRPR